jgi:hypothetical protein
LKGSGDPRLPPDLRWYRDEPEWQSFARQRIEHDLREFTLHVRYVEDFSVTDNVAAEISTLGLLAGAVSAWPAANTPSASTWPVNASRSASTGP